MNTVPKEHKIFLSLCTFLLLGLFAVAPLTRPGFPSTAAGFRPVWGAAAFQACGWPASAGPEGILRGDGPLPLALTALLTASGMSTPAAVKAALALAYLLAGVFLFLWLAPRWGREAALVAAVVYTFAPYRLSVSYVAGGLGEAWALAFYPLAAWALDTFRRRATWWRGLLALGAWGLLALCQLGLALFFALCAGLFFLLAGEYKAVIPLAPALPLLLWGAFQPAAADFSDHYPYVFQLFSAAWSTAPSAPGWMDEMPFQLGLAPLVLAGLGAATILSQGREAGTRRWAALMAGLILLVLLSLRVGDGFWKLSHLASLLSYPWQVLGIVTFGLALLSGVAVREMPALHAPAWLAGLVLLPLLAVYGYLMPAWTTIEPNAAPVGLFGEHQIALVDYRFEGTLQPGEHISLDVVWQDLRPLDVDYTVFVQALDSANTIWGQKDIQPREGELPTSVWQPGQIITDTYAFDVEWGAPAGDLRVIMGFYDVSTGRRLPADGGDHVVLTFPTPAEAVVPACTEGIP